MNRLNPASVFALGNDLVAGRCKLRGETSAPVDYRLQCFIDIFALVFQRRFSVHDRFKYTAPPLSKNVVPHGPNWESLTVLTQVAEVVCNGEKIFVIFLLAQSFDLHLRYKVHVSGCCQDHLFSHAALLYVLQLCLNQLLCEDLFSRTPLPCSNSYGGNDCPDRTNGLDQRGGLRPVGPASDCLPSWVDCQSKAEDQKEKRECARSYRDCLVCCVVVVRVHRTRNRNSGKWLGLLPRIAV